MSEKYGQHLMLKILTGHQHF